MTQASTTELHINVSLDPEEYRRVMAWRQFASTPKRRMNDWAGWAVLVLMPLTVLFLLLVAPDALSVWFWPVAVLAFAYGLYSTLLMRLQIRREARSILAANPLLADMDVHIHEKGIHVSGTDADGHRVKTFLPWKQIVRAQALRDVYLFFITDEKILILPKRCLPDEASLQRLIRQAGLSP